MIASTTARQIEKRINGLKRGKPFSPSQFLKFGSRGAVDQTLHRLVKSGKIVRLSRGIYVKPERNPYIGVVTPPIFEIAKVKADSTNSRIEIGGAEAAHRFGLTTQVPLRYVFYTTGTSAKLKIKNSDIEFKHVSPRFMELAGTAAGAAFVALRYLGKEGVTLAALRQIESRLSKEDFQKLLEAKQMMPSWMVSIVKEYQQEA